MERQQASTKHQGTPMSTNKTPRSTNGHKQNATKSLNDNQ
jgi:hypothetical protein